MLRVSVRMHGNGCDIEQTNRLCIHSWQCQQASIRIYIHHIMLVCPPHCRARNSWQSVRDSVGCCHADETYTVHLVFRRFQAGVGKSLDDRTRDILNRKFETPAPESPGLSSCWLILRWVRQFLCTFSVFYYLVCFLQKKKLSIPVSSSSVTLSFF